MESSTQPSEPSLAVNSLTGFDIRELTFKNVVENILQPAGIKMGGFPDELFDSLSAEERETMMCNICFQVANDCRLCDNQHIFCHSCITAWMMTFGDSARKCPFCRCDQMEYGTDEELQAAINSKKVHCLEQSCSFKSSLADYLMHCHGRSAFSNAHIDLDRLRPTVHRAPGLSSDSSVPLSLRAQLLQSRTMIQQMMMLMRIEMQLRQQALLGLQQTQDAQAQRFQRTDDGYAMGEQLNEISSMLSSLLSPTLSVSRSQRRRLSHRDITARTRPRRLDSSTYAFGPVRWSGGLSRQSMASLSPLPGGAAASDDNTPATTETVEDSSMFRTLNSVAISTSDTDDYDEEEEENVLQEMTEALQAVSDEEDERLWQELSRTDVNDLDEADNDFVIPDEEPSTPDQPLRPCSPIMPTCPEVVVNESSTRQRQVLQQRALVRTANTEVVSQSAMPQREPASPSMSADSDGVNNSRATDPSSGSSPDNSGSVQHGALREVKTETFRNDSPALCHGFDVSYGLVSGASSLNESLHSSGVACDGNVMQPQRDSMTDQILAGDSATSRTQPFRTPGSTTQLRSRHPASSSVTESSLPSGQNTPRTLTTEAVASACSQLTEPSFAARPRRPSSYLTDASRQRVPISSGTASSRATSLSFPRILQMATEQDTSVHLGVTNSAVPELPHRSLSTAYNREISSLPAARPAAARVSHIFENGSYTWPAAPRRVARPQRRNNLSR